MARPRRTAQQRDAVAAFVNRLVEISPATSNVDFANLTGLYDSNVSEYRSGKAVPDGYTLLVMMQAAIGDELAELGVTVDPSALPAPLVPRRTLQAAVDTLLDWRELATDQIAQIETRLETLEGERVSPRRRAARRDAGAGPES